MGSTWTQSSWAITSTRASGARCSGGALKTTLRLRPSGATVTASRSPPYSATLPAIRAVADYVFGMNLVSRRTKSMLQTDRARPRRLREQAPEAGLGHLLHCEAGGVGLALEHAGEVRHRGEAADRHHGAQPDGQRAFARPQDHQRRHRHRAVAAGVCG